MAGFVTVRERRRARGDWDLAVFDARSAARDDELGGFGSNEVAQTFVDRRPAADHPGLPRERARRQPSASRSRSSTRKPPKADGARRWSACTRATDGVLRPAREPRLRRDAQRCAADYADVIAPERRQARAAEEAGPEVRRPLDRPAQGLPARRAPPTRATVATRPASRRCRPAARPTAPTPTTRPSSRQLVKDAPGPGAPASRSARRTRAATIQGIEIADNVEAKDDGRPIYLLVALHHAREWPSAEIAMEFAHMLADGYGKRRRRSRTCCSKERVVIVPIINPDGFVASRGTDPDPADSLMNNGGGLEDNTGQRRRRTTGTPSRASSSRSAATWPTAARTATGHRRRRPGARRRRAEPALLLPASASTRTATTASAGAALARIDRPEHAELPRHRASGRSPRRRPSGTGRRRTTSRC